MAKPKRPGSKPRKRKKATGRVLDSGKGGRTLWTAPRRKKILESVRKGHFRKVAALACQVDERTIKTWMTLGRDNVKALEDGKVKRLNAYGTWCLAMESAEAEAEVDALDIVIDIARDAKGDPRVRLQAAEWYLERKHPTRYGIQRLEVTGAGGGPIEVDARAAILNRLKSMAKRVQASAGA